jgi:pimeloyl-ACP methyl ester carboxylesterase
LGIYLLSFDRPGYGESDPHPDRTEDSIAFDIQELADGLELGHKFYLTGFSMGGEIMWSCLKHIPHRYHVQEKIFVSINKLTMSSYINRLSGVAILGPVGNYWWSGYPTNVSWAAWNVQIPQDQWAVRVAHHAPWLTYWWNTQNFFPASSVIAFNPSILSREDMTLIPKFATRPYAVIGSIISLSL